MTTKKESVETRLEALEERVKRLEEHAAHAAEFLPKPPDPDDAAEKEEE